MSYIVDASQQEVCSSGHDQLQEVHPEVIGITVDLLPCHGVDLGDQERVERAQTNAGEPKVFNLTKTLLTNLVMVIITNT